MNRFFKSRFQSIVRPALGLVMLASLSTFSYTVTSRDSVADGAIFNMSDGSKMKVQVCTDKIIRVVYTKKPTIPDAIDPDSIVIKGTWAPTPFSLSQSATNYSVKTSTVTADVAIASGAVSFSVGGSLILQETAGKTLTQKAVGTYTAYEGTIPFNSTAGEGIYGFGQYQDGQLNQKGQTIDLIQQNQSDCSPMFLSTRGFGVFWNNYSEMKVTPPLNLWCNWATNDAIDYYFIYGPEFDNIIAGYRTITGPAPLWPKWAYGYWQCKNRYSSQDELLTTVKTFRSSGLPIDNIVQDWQYYPINGNGCQCFDPTRYPNMAQMIKTLHDSLHCHFTISVWPSFNPQAPGPNFTFMSTHNYLLSSNDYLGTTYDVFNDSARFYYWKFINDSLVSKGADAFWPDATEPEYPQLWVKATTAQGPALKVQNIFPFLHSKNLHDGFISSSFSKGKRVCNLTRSYYAGSQRLGAGYWTGDIQPDFTTYTNQIPAGLNICATGLPLFCTDVGGFSGVPSSTTLTRWFEWGVFNPIFRIHGTRNTELWLEPQLTTQTTLIKYTKLRYRLLPYIYSLAWKVTNEGYTMMRALPFDFRTDANVTNLGDEFMFGPALLIAPVTDASASSRNVYLPAGKWYDFYTGKTFDGGKNLSSVDAPLGKIPLYVRSGSIIPMGPEVTYADSAADPIELRIYTGADGKFTIYEDEGDLYNYEKGVYATIPIEWNEASGNLKIGPTTGSFPGMLKERTFKVVWVSENHGVDENVTPQASIDKVITYKGGELTLNKASGDIGVISPKLMHSNSSFSAGLQGHSFIVTATGTQGVHVQICDMRGRTVASRTVGGNSSLTVAQQLSSGIYFVKFKQNDFKETKRTFIIP